MDNNQKVIVSFENAGFKNGSTDVFNDLNFNILSGEHYFITGEAGSGKSTLLKAISGKGFCCKGKISYPFFQEATAEKTKEGEILKYSDFFSLVDVRYHYKNLSNMEGHYYQQRYNSMDSGDSQTVLEHLDSISKTNEKGFWTVDKIMKLLNLNNLKDEHLIKLSNGESRRLLIASALLQNPAVLLLDNPFSGLDKEMRAFFDEIFKAISESDITIIMSGNAQEIPEIFTKVLQIENQTIKIFDKEKFINPSNKTSLNIDEKELRDLTSAFEIPRFKTLIQLKKINIQYGGKQILKNIDWTISQGEHWSLSGPNGSGKSTLLSLLNGDNPQSYANDIELFDRKRGSGESIWDIKKNIGFVSPELFQYFPSDITCAKVIESGFYNTLGVFGKPNPKNVELTFRWMSLLKISEFSDRKLYSVSTAISRLCLILRALVRNPTLLILDEPFQNLDQIQIEKFKRIIDLYCESSTTTLIFVSHYENEIPSAVTRKLILKNGEVALKC